MYLIKITLIFSKFASSLQNKTCITSLNKEFTVMRNSFSIYIFKLSTREYIFFLLLTFGQYLKKCMV